MTNDEEIEAVARAICFADGIHPDANVHTTVDCWQEYIPHAKAALSAIRPVNQEMLEAENKKLVIFAKHMFDLAIESSDIDGSDIQDKLEELGLIERKNTDPETNEWGAEWLYCWKEQAILSVESGKGE
jgi:hypothetical protein